MQIYVSYILKQILSSSVLVILTLTSILWLVKTLRLVDLLINKGISLASFLFLSLCIIPSLLFILIPIGTMAGFAIVYNKLSNDSEIIVLRNSGLNYFNIVKPIFYGGSVIVVFSYINSLFLMPLSYSEFKENFTNVRDNYVSILIQERVFNVPIKGLTMYVDQKDPNGILKGILLHDDRVKSKPIILASTGSFISSASGPRLELLNGSRQELDNKGELNILYFDNFSIDISQTQNSEDPRKKESEERFISDLLLPQDQDPILRAKMRAEGIKRITWPLYSIILPLIVMLVYLRGDFSRKGKTRDLIKAFIVACIVIILEISANLLATNFSYLLVVPILYLFAVCFVIMQKLLRRKNYQNLLANT